MSFGGWKRVLWLARRQLPGPPGPTAWPSWPNCLALLGLSPGPLGPTARPFLDFARQGPAAAPPRGGAPSARKPFVRMVARARPGIPWEAPCRDTRDTRDTQDTQRARALPRWSRRSRLSRLSRPFRHRLYFFSKTLLRDPHGCGIIMLKSFLGTRLSHLASETGQKRSERIDKGRRDKVPTSAEACAPCMDRAKQSKKEKTDTRRSEGG